MLWNISFLDFRKANGCGARYTPLKTLLVHPSPLPLSCAVLMCALQIAAAAKSVSMFGMCQKRFWKGSLFDK